MHHATSGHLGRRGTGDVDTLTVREYQSHCRRGAARSLSSEASPDRGARPRAVLPVVLQHRLPVRLMRAGWEPWLSVMSTNLAIATVIGLLVALLGVRDFLLVQAPIILLASSARRLAVLRAARVRAHLVGVGRGLEPPQRRPARQLAL